MTPMISVEGLIWFNAGDIVLTKDGKAAAIEEPDRLIRAIQTALPYLEHRHLVDAGCGGAGPLKDYDHLDFPEFLELLAEIDLAERQASAARVAKTAALRARRVEFSANRPHLILQLLNSGVPYCCDCSVFEYLTVDHKTPISRGGTDDLSNLQFMCRSHNSAKGNRT